MQLSIIFPALTLLSTAAAFPFPQFWRGGGNNRTNGTTIINGDNHNVTITVRAIQATQVNDCLKRHAVLPVPTEAEAPDMTINV